MRRKGPILFLVLALVLAATAAWGAHRFIQLQAKKAEATKTATVPVVVAAAELPAGATIQPTHLRMQEWPRNALPQGFSSSAKKFVGRVVRRPLVPGEVVLAAKLAKEGETGGLSSVLPAGYRAMTVRVDEVIGVAGFVQPRDRVDVLVTFHKNAFKENPVTRIVLSDVLVLAVGERVEEDTQAKRPKRNKVTVVTLQLEPERAEKLALAINEGEAILALRNQGDRDPAATSGVRLTSLLPEIATTAAPVQPSPAAKVTPLAPPEKKAPPPPQPAARPKVEIIKGVTRSTQTL